MRGCDDFPSLCACDVCWLLFKNSSRANFHPLRRGSREICIASSLVKVSLNKQAIRGLYMIRFDVPSVCLHSKHPSETRCGGSWLILILIQRANNWCRITLTPFQIGFGHMEPAQVDGRFVAMLQHTFQRRRKFLMSREETFAFFHHEVFINFSNVDKMCYESVTVVWLEN